MDGMTGGGAIAGGATGGGAIAGGGETGGGMAGGVTGGGAIGGGAMLLQKSLPWLLPAIVGELAPLLQRSWQPGSIWAVGPD